MQKCVFCQIAFGEVPGHKVLEDAVVLGVMSREDGILEINSHKIRKGE